MSRVWFETLGEIAAERNLKTRVQTAQAALKEIRAGRQHSVLAGMLHCTVAQSSALDPTAPKSLKFIDLLEVWPSTNSDAFDNIGQSVAVQLTLAHMAAAVQEPDSDSLAAAEIMASRAASMGRPRGVVAKVVPGGIAFGPTAWSDTHWLERFPRGASGATVFNNEFQVVGLHNPLDWKSRRDFASGLFGRAMHICSHGVGNTELPSTGTARQHILESIASDSHSYLASITRSAMDGAQERSSQALELLERFTTERGNKAIDDLDKLNAIAPTAVTSMLEALCMPAYLAAAPGLGDILNEIHGFAWEDYGGPIEPFARAPRTRTAARQGQPPLSDAASIRMGLGELAGQNQQSAQVGDSGDVPPGGPPGAGGSDGAPGGGEDPPDPDSEPRHNRLIDAQLHCPRFEVGERAYLLVVLRVEGSKPAGSWQKQVELELSPVSIRVEADGFQVLSDPPEPIKLVADKDSTPQAFEIEISSLEKPWLHIFLVQNGRQVGELLIKDFSSLTGSEPIKSSSAPFRPISDPDLSLIVRSGESNFTVSSPRDRANFNMYSFEGFKYPDQMTRNAIRAEYKALYDSTSDVDKTERELQLLGVQLAKALPEGLSNILRRSDIRLVMMRHDTAFEFPLELCYLDGPDPFFVGDRIAVCRWFMGDRCLPDVISKEVRQAAFLKGKTASASVDEALLQRIFHNRTKTFGTEMEVRERVFKTRDFDLIHFTGHCKTLPANTGKGAVFEFFDGSHLELKNIGQLQAECAFREAAPLVVLNACASASPHMILMETDSFVHRFIESNACAVVATLWPISAPIANEFAGKFYEELQSKPIASAMLAARNALLNPNSPSAGTVNTKRDLARRISLRSYCLFANPDLMLTAQPQ